MSYFINNITLHMTNIFIVVNIRLTHIMFNLMLNFLFSLGKCCFFSFCSIFHSAALKNQLAHFSELFK